MPNPLCVVCGKATPPDGLVGEPPRCPICQKVMASSDRLAPALPLGANLSRRGSSPQGHPTTDQDRLRRSSWLGAAGILFLVAIGLEGFDAAQESPGAKGTFVWWVALPGLFSIFGALVLAVIGLQDLARKDAQRRPSLAYPGTANLSHRWGRRFFGGAASLAALGCILSVGLALVDSLPVPLVVFVGVFIVVVIAAVAGTLYLLVVGARVAYFPIARILGRGRFLLRGQEVQAKMSRANRAGAMRRPETASDQIQDAPLAHPGTHIAQE